MNHVVGISEKIVSNDPADVLITYSLGSCVGVSIYDPEVGVGGLIHCMLPLSKTDPQKAKTNPEMFTDTGIASLLEAVYARGGRRKNLIVKVAGGASPLKKCASFNIGSRNYTVLRKIMWKNNILITREDVGGTKPRTMSLFIDEGKTTLKTAGQEIEL